MTRVLITGTAGGIGTGASAELRRRGATVVGVDLTGADSGGRQPPGSSAASAEVLARLGSLDGLSTCVFGSWARGELTTESDDDWAVAGGAALRAL